MAADTRRWWPLGAIALVTLIDVVLRARTWSVPVTGLLDEPAHLATTVVAVCALAPRPTARRVWSLMVTASVLIDIDHIPLYLSDGRFAVDGGRPPTHSLVLILLLIAVGLLPQLRWCLAVSAGVGLHLFRDLASGPGVALFWPVSDRGMHMPEVVYLLLLAALALMASLRNTRSTAVFR